MTVLEIVEAYLEANGYDGLCHTGSKCACALPDLVPGECEGPEDCEPGYRVPCDCGDHDYHITTRKPTAETPAAAATTKEPS